MILRDFIYLDTERLRSFTAQLLGGVPEGDTAERGHEVGATGTAEGSLLKFVRAQGEADYRYHRTLTETRSMHHQVYTLFEDGLIEEGLIEVIDSDFDYEANWTPDHFTDGAFIKVYGHVRFTDYAKSIASMAGFPALFKAFKIVQLSSIKTTVDSGDITPEEATAQRRDLNKTEAEIKDLPLQQLSVLGETLYEKGVVRVKVQPADASEGRLFVGNGRTDALLEPLGGGGMTESPSSTDWVAVGQVSAAEEDDELQPLPTGNGMEDAIEGMSVLFRSMVHAGTSAIFPALTFTPLAVYREIGT